MVRVRTWRTRPYTGQVLDTFYSQDLTLGLAGVGPGATLQRCLGSFDINAVRGSGGSTIQYRWGVLVTTTPSQALIASSNNYPWIAYGAGSLETPELVAGSKLTTAPDDDRFSWDSAGQREFGPGERVWLMLTLMGFRDNPRPEVTGYARTLVLGPDE